ncbi:MAG TPA: CHAT domain-containing protein [Thermoanaerobaculia bacterium]
MDPRHVLEAVLVLWDDLPFILGMDAWRDLYGRLVPLLDKLKADDEDERSLAAADVIGAFAAYPEARRRLNKAVEHIRIERSATGPAPQPSPAWERLLATLEDLVRPATVTRYTDVLAPRRVQRGKRATVNVALTAGPEVSSRESRALEVKTGRSVEVTLRALTPGLTVTSAARRRLRVLRTGDTPPVAFFFKGTELGAQLLAVEFHQQGRLAGRVRLPVEVIREIPADDETHDVAGPVFAARPVAQPADLEVRIELERREGRDALKYTLSSPSRIAPFHDTRFQGPELPGSAEAYRAALRTKIENLELLKDIDGRPLLLAEIPGKLEGIGRDLYRELFAGEMLGAYRGFRKLAQTIQITSSDPWIPWEILKPYDDSDPDPARLIDDDFLGCRFAVTRWLAGRRVPADEVRVERLACIEAGSADEDQRLAYAGTERDLLAGLAVAHGLQDASLSIPDRARLLRLLTDGRAQLLHFVTHGEDHAVLPAEAGLLLADGSMFCANDLHGPLATRISEDRPLVFLNACRAGQRGLSLTGPDGWVERWVSLCGCGALVAPLWAVDDEMAFETAKAFYETLEQGGTFGEAARAARLRGRDLEEASPTWMAYVVYAHPNGRMVFETGGAPGDGRIFDT